MASPFLTNPFSLAPRNLAQMINPLYWLNSGTGQIGLVNISGTASAKPELEANIVENVATYGRQLGRISDVVEAILSQSHPEKWPPPQREAVSQFREMTAKIAAVKAGFMAPTRENVEQLIAGINSLKETDKSEYVRITKELKEKLFTDAVDKVEIGNDKPRAAGGRSRI
jgi:hypothetical protein